MLTGLHERLAVNRDAPGTAPHELFTTPLTHTTRLPMRVTA
ncbi:MAG: hypothetical protein QOF45_1888 [Gaiellaceae bacterium]|nr:hypothetical protein [Gaiellaceae bacterium]